MPRDRAVRQAGQLIVVGEMVKVLLLLEKLRLHFPADADVVRGERE